MRPIVRPRDLLAETVSVKDRGSRTYSSGEDFEEAVVDAASIVELVLGSVQSNQVKPSVNVTLWVIGNSVLQLTNTVLRQTGL